MVSSQQPRQRRSTAAFGSGSTSQLSTITVLRSVLFTKQLNAYVDITLIRMMTQLFELGRTSDRQIFSLRSLRSLRL